MWSLKVTLYWLDMYLSAIIGDIGFSVVCISIMSHSHARQEHYSHTIRKSFGISLVGLNGRLEMRNSFWGLGVCWPPRNLSKVELQNTKVIELLCTTPIHPLAYFRQNVFFYTKLSIQLPSSIFVGKEGMITMEQVERADIQQTLNQTSARLVQRYSTR